MPVIPCMLCGPLHILPLRLRCRVYCLIKKDVISLTDANDAIGTTYNTPEDLANNITDAQALVILQKTGKTKAQRYRPTR